MRRGQIYRGLSSKNSSDLKSRLQRQGPKGQGRRYSLLLIDTIIIPFFSLRRNKKREKSGKKRGVSPYGAKKQDGLAVPSPFLFGGQSPVDLGAKNQRQARGVKPEEQHHHTAQGPVQHRVVGDVFDIKGKAQGEQKPGTEGGG